VATGDTRSDAIAVGPTRGPLVSHTMSSPGILQRTMQPTMGLTCTCLEGITKLPATCKLWRRRIAKP